MTQDMTAGVHAIWADGDGMIVATECHGGSEARIALERLSAAGAHEETVQSWPILCAEPDRHPALIARLTQGAGCLFAAHDGQARILLALDPAYAGAAAALGDHGDGPIEELICAGGYVVALHAGKCPEAEQGLAALRLEDGAKLQALDLEALGLTPTRRITALCVTGDVLSVAVADARAGAELWQMDLTGVDAPRAVFTRGGFRFAFNAALPVLHAQDEVALFGTAGLTSMEPPLGNWGPEIGVIGGEEGWDLLIGQPRFSPDGLKLPASAQTAGLGDPANAAVKAIASEPGGRVFAILQEHLPGCLHDRDDVVPVLDAYCGPARLIVSDDLVNWTIRPLALAPETGAIHCVSVIGGRLAIGHEALSASSDAAISVVAG